MKFNAKWFILGMAVMLSSGCSYDTYNKLHADVLDKSIEMCSGNGGLKYIDVGLLHDDGARYHAVTKWWTNVKTTCENGAVFDFVREEQRDTGKVTITGSGSKPLKVE